MHTHMKRRIITFLRNTQAVALIEFAIVFPVMFLMLFAGIEVSRYILIIQKTEKSAYALTNIVAQFPTATTAAAAGEISDAQMIGVFNQLFRLMSPYGTGGVGSMTNGGAFITSVVRQGGVARIRWQRSGGGTLGGATSVVNGAGLGTTLNHAPGAGCPIAPFNGAINANLATMREGENMIVGEVSFRYIPIMTDFLGVVIPGLNEQILTRQIFIHPRSGDLLNLPPGTPANSGPCV